MVLDTVLTLLVMDMDILDTLLLAMAMGMVTDMDIMVRIFGNTNQELKTECTFYPFFP